MMLLSKWLIILFGVFIITAGVIMLFKPLKAREILRKAGSTNLINYGEITIRLLIAIAIILYADLSKYPDALNILGWFMLVTALILYVVPRKLHHYFSLQCAEILKPLYFRLLSPFSFLFGSVVIYSVI